MTDTVYDCVFIRPHMFSITKCTVTDTQYYGTSRYTNLSLPVPGRVIKTDNTIKIENVRQEDGDIMQRCDTGELTAMCSLVWMGMKPTNEICIDSSVPRQYTYNTQRHRHTSITVEDCRFFLVSLNQLKNL